MPDGTAAIPDNASDALSERQTLILEAFERCIVRTGFHATTMQDVAREAGMSAGNLYRYFASKEALVSGLAGLDRQRYGATFKPPSEGEDVMTLLERRGHMFMVEMPPYVCVKSMEIWAEATRNPQVAAVCRAKIKDIGQHIGGMLQAAKDAGQIAPSVDVGRMVMALMALTDGLQIRRAIDPDYDAEDGFALLRSIIGAVASGKLDLSPDHLPPLSGIPVSEQE